MRNIFNYISFALSLILAIAMVRCQKSVSTHDVIHIHATSKSALADGSSLDTVYADLPINSLASSRGVTFFASSGLFSNGFDTLSVFASRTDITPNKITAFVIWHASLRSGPDTLTASNTVPSVYTDTLTLNLTASTIDSIQLIPSSPTVKDTFGMQIPIIVLPSNKEGGLVSLGTTIQFTDSANGGPAGGYFVPPFVTMDSSKGAVLYFPPYLPAGATTGDTITIRATAKDASGTPTGRPGTTKIFFSP